MSQSLIVPSFDRAQTLAVRRALVRTADASATADLLFLERWEMAPVAGAAAALRMAQIRRANPELAAAVRQEIAQIARNGAASRVAPPRAQGTKRLA